MVTWPLFAGIGATPASIANAASEWIRPGWDQAHKTVAATIGPTPNSSSRSGRHEPSAVAIHLYTGEVLWVGAEAYKMLGREPKDVEVFRPIRNGTIDNFEATEKMLKGFIARVNGGGRSHMVIGVPGSSTSLEQRSVRDAARDARAKRVDLVDEGLCAAIGAGLGQGDDPAGQVAGGLAFVRLWRAKYLLPMGRPALALTTALRAADGFRAQRNQRGLARALLTAAQADAQRGDFRSAVRRLDVAADFFADLAATDFEAEALLTAAELYDRAGQPEQAEAVRTRAYDLASRIEGGRGRQLQERALGR